MASLSASDSRASSAIVAVFVTVAFLVLVAAHIQMQVTLRRLVEQIGTLQDTLELNAKSASESIKILDSKLQALDKKISDGIGQVCWPFKMRVFGSHQSMVSVPLQKRNK